MWISSKRLQSLGWRSSIVLNFTGISAGGERNCKCLSEYVRRNESVHALETPEPMQCKWTLVA